METTNTEPLSLLTADAVRHVAKLARLALTDQEILDARHDLATIFEHIDRLRLVETEGVAPLDHPTEIQNRIRGDEVGGTLSQEEVLSNAPAIVDVYLDVPKVLGGDA